MGRDRAMLEPARHVATTYALRGIPSFVFRFSYVEASMRDQWKAGVPHAMELPFVFNTVRTQYGAATTPADEKAADQIQTYYANFAKTGDPNRAGLPEWPKYDPSKDVLMNSTMDDGPAAVQYADSAAASGGARGAARGSGTLVCRYTATPAVCDVRDAFGGG